jgi:GT2 family glycosyltransferase
MKLVNYGFVILNYLSFEDSVNAVNSILNIRTKFNESILIYVVDNHSSQLILNSLTDALKSIPNLKIIVNDINIGFARGQNVGIEAALKDDCKFITCLNNDVTITSKDYIELLNDTYGTQGSAIIGPMIMTSSGVNQNPFLLSPPTVNQIEYRKKLYTTTFGKFKFWTMHLKNYFFAKSLHEPTHQTKNIDEGTYYALHGAIFALTPTFFKYYNGLDPNTFLYGEELILAAMLESHGMTAYYQPNIQATHEEDVATNLLLSSNKLKKYIFCLKHEYNSIRHLYSNYF